MPILQSENPTASILGPLLGLAAGFIKNNVARKDAQKAAEDKAKQQTFANTNTSNQTAIAANNAGMVVGPDGKVAPWKPPAPAAPSGPTSQPGLQGLLAGLAQPAQPNLGPKAPKLGAPVNDATMNALPSSVTGKQPAAAPGKSDPLEGFNQEAALSKSMSTSLMGVYQSEAQQVTTLRSQNAPEALIKRHQDAADKALTEAGSWVSRQQAAESAIAKAQGANAPAKPTWADTHPTYSEQHPQPAKPTYAELHPQPPKPTWADLHPKPPRPREGEDPNSAANRRFDWERHTWEMTHNPDGSTKGSGKVTAEKPRGLSVNDEQAINKEAQVQMRDPNANPDTVAQNLANKWGLPIAQARAFVPGSGQSKAPVVNTPATVKLPGTGKSLSRADAIKVGGPDGVAKAQALGYTVH